MINCQIRELKDLNNIDVKKLYNLHLLLPKNDQMSYKNFTDEFYSQNRYYCFATIDENIVGYIGIFDAIDVYEIIGIAVDEKFQNIGIGKKLLSNIKLVAKEKNISLISLEVDVTNKKAIDFYKKNGFQVTNIRKNYYKDNDAYVMHCYL